jgi:hypothetical protein
LVAGHVARSGTRADVVLQNEFMKDLKAAAGAALKSTPVGVGLELIFYTSPKIVLYYQRVAVARNERGTTDGGIGAQLADVRATSRIWRMVDGRATPTA